MLPLPDPRHELFVRALASGCNVALAYHQAGYLEESHYARAQALSEDPQILARLAHLRKVEKPRSRHRYWSDDSLDDFAPPEPPPPASTRPTTRAEMHDWLWKIAGVDNGFVCPSRIRAAMFIARANGWDKPEPKARRTPSPQDQDQVPAHESPQPTESADPNSSFDIRNSEFPQTASESCQQGEEQEARTRQTSAKDEPSDRTLALQSRDEPTPDALAKDGPSSQDLNLDSSPRPPASETAHSQPPTAHGGETSPPTTQNSSFAIRHSDSPSIYPRDPPRSALLIPFAAPGGSS
ncbi:MAG: hypothetical protein U0984_17210 [Prosthecobacter sp.]|nr:hypothetical protein [Prosthecobacter sp.]